MRVGVDLLSIERFNRIRQTARPRIRPGLALARHRDAMRNLQTHVKCAGLRIDVHAPGPGSAVVTTTTLRTSVHLDFLRLAMSTRSSEGR